MGFQNAHAISRIHLKSKVQGLIVLRIRSHLIVQPKHEFRAAEFQLRVDPRLQSPDGIDAATILVSTIMVKKHKREDLIDLYIVSSLWKCSAKNVPLWLYLCFFVHVWIWICKTRQIQGFALPGKYRLH